jgi:hypothetical protein
MEITVSIPVLIGLLYWGMAILKEDPITPSTVDDLHCILATNGVTCQRDSIGDSIATL